MENFHSRTGPCKWTTIGKRFKQFKNNKSLYSYCRVKLWYQILNPTRIEKTNQIIKKPNFAYRQIMVDHDNYQRHCGFYLFYFFNLLFEIHFENRLLKILLSNTIIHFSGTSSIIILSQICWRVVSHTGFIVAKIQTIPSYLRLYDFTTRFFVFCVLNYDYTIISLSRVFWNRTISSKTTFALNRKNAPLSCDFRINTRITKTID